MEENKTQEVSDVDENQTNNSGNISETQNNYNQGENQYQTIIDEVTKLITIKLEGLSNQFNNKFLALADELHERLNNKNQPDTQEKPKANQWKVF